MGLQLTLQVRVQLHCLQVQHTVTDNLLRLGLQKEVFGKTVWIFSLHVFAVWTVST